mmetsp:Transcript_107728/g.322222  ORF Transcript_107728/g.322222 Transcript_107728/m.322222 type:complete len:268 (-) Transcript_107728:1114-1917(-)
MYSRGSETSACTGTASLSAGPALRALTVAGCGSHRLQAPRGRQSGLGWRRWPPRRRAAGRRGRPAGPKPRGPSTPVGRRRLHLVAAPILVPAPSGGHCQRSQIAGERCPPPQLQAAAASRTWSCRRQAALAVQFSPPVWKSPWAPRRGSEGQRPLRSLASVDCPWCPSQPGPPASPASSQPRPPARRGRKPLQLRSRRSHRTSPAWPLLCGFPLPPSAAPTAAASPSFSPAGPSASPSASALALSSLASVRRPRLASASGPPRAARR